MNDVSFMKRLPPDLVRLLMGGASHRSFYYFSTSCRHLRSILHECRFLYPRCAHSMRLTTRNESLYMREPSGRCQMYARVINLDGMSNSLSVLYVAKWFSPDTVTSERSFAYSDRTYYHPSCLLVFPFPQTSHRNGHPYALGLSPVTHGNPRYIEYEWMDGPRNVTYRAYSRHENRWIEEPCIKL